jgi:hypothetical protein
MNKNVELANRKSAFAELKDFCVFSMGVRKGHGDYIEVTEWSNTEGIDVKIYDGNGIHKFMLTYGQFDALKACVKQINNAYNSKEL